MKLNIKKIKNEINDINNKKCEIEILNERGNEIKRK
jgi:hypothetical protein